ncbi:hypothetical protein Tsubulata_036865 [Turnera subulata]|uniref:DUF4283 domain-containing protein n=1 Tax=Turnera subulata TaxID=218843 RepID=A0A9Q0JS09_9ROSI|nr:hypothetical protein Tsubulata_036865 [Turnera subulata]
MDDIGLGPVDDIGLGPVDDIGLGPDTKERPLGLMINKNCNGMIIANLGRNMRVEARNGTGVRVEQMQKLNIDKSNVRAGHSFAQAAGSNLAGRQEAAGNVGGDASNKSAIYFHPDDQWLNKIKTYAFGAVCEGVRISGIKSLIKSSLKQEVSVKALGGCYVLMKFKTREILLECLKSEVLLNLGIFYLLKEWELNECASHRLCWINIHGTPPVAWCKDFFSMISIRFGKFIHLQNELESSADLTLARVLIQTTYKVPISRLFEVVIGDNTFTVFMEEMQSIHPAVFEDEPSDVVKSARPVQVGVSGDQSNHVPDNEEINESPDPFGTLETIKNIKKGKVVAKVSQVIGKFKNSNCSWNWPIVPYESSPLSSKDNPSTKDSLGLENQMRVTKPNVLVGSIRESPSTLVEESIIGEGRDAWPIVNRVESDENSTGGIINSNQKETLANQEESCEKELNISLKLLQRQFRALLEKANFHRGTRWGKSGKMKKLKKVCKGGGVRLLRPGDSSNQDCDIKKGNMRAVEASVGNGKEAVNSKLSRSAKVSITMEVGRTLGLLVGDGSAKVERVVEGLIEKEHAEWEHAQNAS